MIQRINLIPDELKIKKTKIALPVKHILVIVVALLYIMPLHIKILRETKKTDSDKLMLEAKKLELVTNNMKFALLQEEATKKMDEIALIKGKSKTLKNILQNRAYWSDILKEMSHIVPENLWLSEIISNTTSIAVKTEPANEPNKEEAAIEKEVKEVKIRGSSYNNKTIKDFIAKLEKAYYFDNVRLNYIKKRIINNVFIVYDFEISSTIKVEDKSVAN